MYIIGSILLVILIVFSIFKIVREYDRLVVFRLGKFLNVKGPGLVAVIPGLDKTVKVTLRTITVDIPPQDIITRDNVSVSVNAVVYFRVMEPNKAVIEIENYMFATSQIAQTTLRSVLGEFDLDELLSQREKINLKLQTIIDEQTDPWGIKVSLVEIKHVDLPELMQRAMARQAEAERERRAKIIAADGELQASLKLVEAAQNMSKDTISVQLRYLQTLSDISMDNSSTIIFPVPVDTIQSLMNKK